MLSNSQYGLSTRCPRLVYAIQITPHGNYRFGGFTHNAIDYLRHLRAIPSCLVSRKGSRHLEGKWPRRSVRCLKSYIDFYGSSPLLILRAQSREFPIYVTNEPFIMGHTGLPHRPPIFRWDASPSTAVEFIRLFANETTDATFDLKRFPHRINTDSIYRPFSPTWLSFVLPP